MMKRNCVVKNQSVSPSLSELLASVYEQIEIHDFEKPRVESAKEISLIIAEIYASADIGYLKINGEMLPAKFVKDVFYRITFEHVNCVIDNFKNQRKTIQNVKGYLRTALYNSVFEIDGRITNDLKSAGVI